MTQPHKHILLIVAGITPQVITEALFILSVKDKITIHELYILTTPEQRGFIESILPIKLQEFSLHFNVEKPLFITGRNILTGTDTEIETENSFENVALHIIRSLTEERDSRLFCCVAGGRKTMSVKVAFAMMLYGRRIDELFHVVASKEFMASTQYFPTSELSEEIVRMPIPFLRLRGKIPALATNANGDFTLLIESAQQVIDGLVNIPTLILQSNELLILIDNKIIQFTPMQFSVYYTFAQQKEFIKGGKQLSASDEELFLQNYKRFCHSEGQLARVQDSAKKDKQSIFSSTKLTKIISEINRTISDTLLNKEMESYFQITKKGGYCNKSYGLTLPSHKRIFQQ